MIDIRPIPPALGVGVCARESLPMDGYRHEVVDEYHNYHATPARWRWPDHVDDRPPVLLDGFSPNLNKRLHVGHLRNLAAAVSLVRLCGPDARAVAILGAAGGVVSGARDDFDRWCKFVGYHPQVYLDAELPWDIVPRRLETVPPYAGCEVFDGPNGPVPVTRSDGRHLYAFHDLAFAAAVGPTHYLVGAEQTVRFADLGLPGQYLPLGLLLDANGKKMSSRDGGATPAAAFLDTLEAALDVRTPEKRRLAWNVAAWNMLRVGRAHDIRFEPGRWVAPQGPGLHITYTAARVRAALADEGLMPPELDLTDADAQLAGAADYYFHHARRAVTRMDPAPVAAFAADLAHRLGQAYAAERIKGGRPGFVFAVHHALCRLELAMKNLGMFVLDRV